MTKLFSFNSVSKRLYYLGDDNHNLKINYFPELLNSFEEIFLNLCYL